MTYVGTTFPILLKARLRQTRDGTVVEQPYKVLTSEVNLWVDELRSQGFTEIAADPQDGTPFHIVTVATTQETGATDILSDTWAIAYNEEQLSIWSLPAVRDEMRATTPENAALFRADVEAVFQGQRYVQDEAGTAIPVSFTSLLALAGELGMDTSVIEDLFRSLGDGVESYIESLPVLRRRMTVPVGTTLKPALTSIGAIYSKTALLTARPTIPSNLHTDLPSTGYWLKKAPTAEQAEDGRWTYTEEFWYVKQYDPFIYTEVYT